MTTWILDKSAHVRLVAGATPPAGIDLTDLAICDIGELEWLYSARSATDYDSQQTSLRAYQILRAPSDIFDRVRHLQRDLAHHRGMWHRTPLPDLFIAETALHHRAGVLHHDRDYKRIAVVRPGFQACELSRALASPESVSGGDNPYRPSKSPRRAVRVRRSAPPGHRLDTARAARPAERRR